MNKTKKRLVIRDLFVEVYKKDKDSVARRLLGADTQKNTQLLSNINIFVNNNEKVGLVGESGAGKSLTVKSIMGLYDMSPGIVNGEISYYDDKSELVDILSSSLKSGKKNSYQETISILKTDDEFILPKHINFDDITAVYAINNLHVFKALPIENIRIEENRNTISFPDTGEYGYLYLFVNSRYKHYRGEKEIREKINKLKNDGFNFAGENCSMILQDPKSFLHPYHAVENELKTLSVDIDDNYLEDILEDLGLNNPRFLDAIPGELSGGQAQRMMIIMGHLVNSKLLVADEPTTGLDVSVKKKVVELFKKKKDSLIFISHDINMVRHITDRMYVMHKGQIIELDNSKSFSELENHHPYSRKLIASSHYLEFEDEINIKTSSDKENNGCSYYEKCTNHFERCQKLKAPAIDKESGKILVDIFESIAWATCWKFLKSKDNDQSN